MNMLLKAGGFDLSALFDNISSTIKAFRAADAIEILILAVIFFFAFRFLSSRKTVALLIGIFVCLFLLGI